MPEEQFKPGDVVRLKSGGRPMTVSKCEGDDVTCVWEENGVNGTATYPAVVVARYKPPTASIRVGRA
jgi:uncharacterized protein YodC (DUF2158 family)